MEVLQRGKASCSSFRSEGQIALDHFHRSFFDREKFGWGVTVEWFFGLAGDHETRDLVEARAQPITIAKEAIR